MTKRNAKSKAKMVLALICGLLVYRVAFIGWRMLYDSLHHLLGDGFSLAMVSKSGEKKDIIRATPSKGRRAGFGFNLFLLVKRVGKEHILALFSLCALAGLLLLMQFLPRLSVAVIAVTVVVFLNVFLSKMFLLSRHVRIMTRRFIFWEPPTVSGFLLAFPLDYLAIVVSYANFYSYLSRFSHASFMGRGGVILSLDLHDSVFYSLSSITTLNLSGVTPVTALAKLLTFSELFLAIFFLVMIGSIVIGLFLTEKAAAEKDAWMANKKTMWGFLSILSRLVMPSYKTPSADSEPERTNGEDKSGDEKELSPRTGVTPRMVVIKIDYPESESIRGLELTISPRVVKRLVGTLPEQIRQKAQDVGADLEQIITTIDGETAGPVCNIQVAAPNQAKVTIDVSITDGH